MFSLGSRLMTTPILTSGVHMKLKVNLTVKLKKVVNESEIATESVCDNVVESDLKIGIEN